MWRGHPHQETEACRDRAGKPANDHQDLQAAEVILFDEAFFWKPARPPLNGLVHRHGRRRPR